ncbi:cytochrome-c oxidase, cbb3-type subunit I [Rickettsiales endosymbiont of Trichoplax sp. H2]|uniref:cytochrome-c oxidase, cbb3-type subunit I n=1 Tax=Rickettsiales endosymbiont of Trichoplax sp. H2 TaxID=2021221 RepID=UPI0012B21CD4|nr:cytochrome-c oxidase, cbb3-type subunit I [Rickettsiales endosymbiont of Trichoplax sp. H2]MSO14173.1 Cytochrome c oxidase subunit 1-like protein [Rickettsiales endosymbiont of Trichoplax sp. H2]
MNIVNYDYKNIKLFAIASLFWAIIGMGAGVFIAFQMVFPELSFGIEWTTFGRLRPIHTSGVIFAFGGNVLLGASFYVLQRTCQVRIYSSKIVSFIFYSFQIFLLLAVSGYVMGITQGKEYAEPEWYADILLTVTWLLYLFVYLMTLKNRKEPHIYVANWFFMAFIIVIAVLHVGNNISIPISWNSAESISFFSGVQSAMIQWWYGHNAVGFWLTAAFIGIMYYFVPKRANRPVYSYRLSILHFWSLIFIYIWAGPHHLIYTSLPDWVQTLGMTMSIILWLPSWGGMVNGIMTLSGAWYKLRNDPVLRFLIIAVAFYGMSTFEGPVMAIKSVNALSHYTEWTISHVHSGALGWVALISFGALYHMIPDLWGKKEMYSVKLISIHLWLACLGIVLYITSMWTAGITQGLMWRSYDDMGFLKYSFIEVVKVLSPYYLIRALGGLLFWLGALIMVYNTIKTIKDSKLGIVKNNKK